MTFALLVLGLLGAGSLQAWRGKAMSQTAEKKGEPLTWILHHLAADYDCFFTVEVGWREDDPGGQLEAEWAERDTERTGLVQQLEHLRQTVPNFSYEVDPANSRIVHIMDARLRQQQGYALEATIRSIDYTGKANDLPDEIRRQGVRIAVPTGRDTREFQDRSTVVRIREERLTVRGALSDFIQLDGRGNRILWIARTKLEAGTITYVHYPWPGKTANQ